MPVTRDEFAEECTQENADALRERLKYLQGNGWSVPRFIEEAKLLYTNESKLGRFMNEPENWDKLNFQDYQRLVNFLFDRKLWQDKDFSRHIQHYKDNLYHSLIDFLRVGPGTENNMQGRAQGLYRLWRHSIMLPGKYAVGQASIWHEEDSGALCVREVFVYEDEGEDEKLHFRPMRDEHVGYLVRKNKKYFILSRNKSVSTLQMTSLPNVHRLEDQITTMSGIVQSMSGSRLFTSRILYERFDGSEKELEEMTGIYDRSKIPELVLAVLDRKFGNAPGSPLMF